MPEITVDIDVGVWCAVCGAGLCRQAQATNGHDIAVEPCEKCLTRAMDEGYAKGWNAAYEEEENR